MADSIKELVDNFHKEKDGRGKIPIEGDEHDLAQHKRPEMSNPHDVLQTGHSSVSRVAHQRHEAAEEMHGSEKWIHGKQ